MYHLTLLWTQVWLIWNLNPESWPVWKLNLESLVRSGAWILNPWPPLQGPYYRPQTLRKCLIQIWSFSLEASGQKPYSGTQTPWFYCNYCGGKSQKVKGPIDPQQAWKKSQTGLEEVPKGPNDLWPGPPPKKPVWVLPRTCMGPSSDLFSTCLSYLHYEDLDLHPKNLYGMETTLDLQYMFIIIMQTISSKMFWVFCVLLMESCCNWYKPK